MKRKTKTPAGTAPRKSAPIYLHSEQFIGLLPVPVSESQLLQWAKTNKFPPGVRFNSKRSRPLYDRDAVIRWVGDVFKDTHPVEVIEFERELLRKEKSCAITTYYRRDTLRASSKRK